jgi:uncharacterized protein (DUF2147 family)
MALSNAGTASVVARFVLAAQAAPGLAFLPAPLSRPGLLGHPLRMRNSGSDEILGSWMSEGWKVRLEFFREGDSYFAILAEGLENGERDMANPDPSKRNAPFLGSRLIEGLRWNGKGGPGRTWSGGTWSGGTIYDPQSGKRYSCAARLVPGSGAEGPVALDVRGYVGLPFIGIAQRMERPGTRPDLEFGHMAGAMGADAPKPWSLDRARAWRDSRPWIIGCNFIPSSASNQLEMWQARTFDPAGIARELDLARGLGFNALRVYLHYLPWKTEREGFLGRIDRFLALAAERGMSTLFVLFDDCWNDDPRPGRQRPPRPGVHNSRWVRCPGSRIIRDEGEWPGLEAYVRGTMGAFGKDGRVLGWDLYNEIGNGAGFLPETTRLLARVFLWARQAEPSQPLTAGIWKRSSWFAGVNRFLAENSDVVSFHNYAPLDSLKEEVEGLAAYGRPLLCTEYMSRGQGSLFSTHAPYLKERGVGAFNWGLVDGRTQTKFPWASRRGSAEPALWFHDIFRADGSPYDEEEAACLRSLSGSTGTDAGGDGKYGSTR